MITPIFRNARHGLVLAGGLLGAAALSGCQPTLGQTGVVVAITTEAPIDCVAVEAREAPSGGKVREETGKSLGAKALDDFRNFSMKVLIYAGGQLGDDGLEVVATGFRGGCSGDAVATGTARSTFQRGSIGEVAIVMKRLGTDTDLDGYSDPFDCGPGDPLVFPRAQKEAASARGVECGDGVDNNCDATIDEGCPCSADRACHPFGLGDPRAGVGACTLGTQRCSGGALGPCEDAGKPTPEQCDGIDNDCDGVPDLPSCPCTEGEMRDCYGVGPASAAGEGLCALGQQTCTGGFFGPCTGDVPPTRETCNGADDDCDGVVDNPESVDTPLCTEKQLGVCAGARRGCGESACTSATFAKAAAALGLKYVEIESAYDCDGIDNDCDGDIDETCECDRRGQKEPCFPLGATRPEGLQGECRRGTRTCDQDLKWGECVGAIGPVAETCNGKDDDCDGTVDEDTPGSGVACPTGRPGLCASGERRCVTGELSCVSRRPAGPEVCDGADNNCDGTVDDGFDKRNDPAHCGGPNDCTACATGNACCDGKCSNTTTDPRHCGACGKPCETGETCCGGGCRNLQTDAANCGECGKACPAARVCRTGVCVPPNELACDDGADDDRDALVDCEDPDCLAETACEKNGNVTVRVCRQSRCVPKAEAGCADLLDNDFDGLVDCEDPDCTTGTKCGEDGARQKVCRTPLATEGHPAPLGRCVFADESKCANGDDDDLDGKVDCLDPDCAAKICDDTGGVCWQSACAHETLCSNAADDDRDGRIDCADADCPTGTTCDAQGRSCFDGACTGETLCADGRDDNGNGLVDCADPGCAAGTACGGGGTCCVVGGQRACAKELDCNDGADDDCDGKVDCQDADCPVDGRTFCAASGRCFNLATDLDNCKACGTRCDDANACTVDACGAAGCTHANVVDRTQPGACNGARLCCGGQCVSGTESGAACTDGLDNDCDGKADCQDPDCGCSGGGSCCGLVCRDLQIDVDHCGDCNHKCTTANVCEVSSCARGTCATAAKPDRTSCGTGTVCCGGGCVPGVETTATCNDGLDNDCDGLLDCQDSDCPANGRTYCSTTRRCFSLQTDPNNCGECGKVCATGEFCHLGVCARELVCADGLDDDGDSMTDCADPDCGDGATCATNRVCCGGTCKAEICHNGVDDDCDGLADCLDPGCQNQACNDGSACTSGETCQGLTGTCGGGTPAVCPAPDQCQIGPGVCDVVDGLCKYALKAADTACTDDGNPCTRDACNGTAASCQHPAGNAGVSCRASAGECDLAEICTGTSTTCGPDLKKAANTACTDDGLPCSRDVCDGSSATCTHPPQGAGTQCRASAGECDVAETCNGSALTCPTDAFQPSSTVCRGAAGDCDLAENCTGGAAACPGDARVANGTVCRGSGGACDVAETCNGGVSCPGDAFLPSSTVCRGAQGDCDLAENCTGGAAACPGDARAANGTVCRASGGDCDVAETCNGGVSCPGDAFQPSSTVCRGAAGDCDLAENCTGGAAACPGDARVANGTVCRGSGGICDVAETCNGGVSCPGDGKVAAGTECRGSAGRCDPPEVCNGSSNTCPGDARVARGGEGWNGDCGGNRRCDGSNDVCPGDCLESGNIRDVLCDGTHFCSSGGVCTERWNNGTSGCTRDRQCKSSNCTGSNGLECRP